MLDPAGSLSHRRLPRGINLSEERRCNQPCASVPKRWRVPLSRACDRQGVGAALEKFGCCHHGHSGCREPWVWTRFILQDGIMKDRVAKLDGDTRDERSGLGKRLTTIANQGVDHGANQGCRTQRSWPIYEVCILYDKAQTWPSDYAGYDHGASPSLAAGTRAHGARAGGCQDRAGAAQSTRSSESGHDGRLPILNRHRVCGRQTKRFDGCKVGGTWEL